MPKIMPKDFTVKGHILVSWSHSCAYEGKNGKTTEMDLQAKVM